MGPGIFTRYSKQVIGGILAVFAAFGAVLLYFQLRDPVGGLSPHETVNDLYEWECMTFEPEQAAYPVDVETVRLRFRNDAPDGVVCLSAGRTFFRYELEIQRNGAWHQMHSYTDQPRWDGKTDIVNWDGGEITLSCPVGRDYPSPLKPGRYRIVLPECEHLHSPIVALAAEFEVVEEGTA